MRHLLLLAFCLLVTTTALAGKPPSVEAITHEVYRDRRVQIVSDMKHAPAEARLIAREIERARRGARRQTLHESPGRVRVELLSPKLFRKVTGYNPATTAGYAVDKLRMIFPGTLGKNMASADVLAHEVTHLEDFRSARGRVHEIPLFLQEGKAFRIGNGYQRSLGGERHPGVTDARAVMAKLTPRQARQVFSEFRSDADAIRAGETGYRYEVTGALFVEFLRTRLDGGVRDALPRLARMVEKVGRGLSYSAAFESEFGMGPRRAQNEFVRFIAATKGDPTARLRRTLYAR